MKRKEGMILARRFHDLLRKEGIPVEKMFLYGSVARDEAVEDSDIDVAVITMPFLPSRTEENATLWRLRRRIDLRIEPVSLHPEDFENRLLALPREIERTGVEV